MGEQLNSKWGNQEDPMSLWVCTNYECSVFSEFQQTRLYFNIMYRQTGVPPPCGVCGEDLGFVDRVG